MSYENLDPTRGVLYELVPWPMRAAGWLFFGILSPLLVASRHRVTGLILISLMPAQRLISHVFAAGAVGWPTDSISGDPSSLGSAVVWASVLWLIREVAGWPDLEGRTTR